MSRTAQALLKLLRLAQGGAGALTVHLMHEIAAGLLAPAMNANQRTLGSRNRAEFANFTKGMK